MTYGIVNVSTLKRIKLKTGEYTPVFNYPYEAQKYIDKILGGSRYCIPKKLGGEK